MKPPISYYGGKQRIAKRIARILDSIPHKIYCEPFAGGLAVLYAKSIPKVSNHTEYREAINDTDQNLVTFYKVVRENPNELIRWIEFTPYSRMDHILSRQIYKNPKDYSDLEVAWAVYLQCNMTFSKRIGAGWATSLYSENNSYTWENRKNRLFECFDRLKEVYVDCQDALNFIKQWDSCDTLFYCDPPYPNTNQGHFKGYTLQDWKELCDLLDNIKGSYVLSGYPIDVMPKSAQSMINIKAIMSAAGNTKKTRARNNKPRTEVLWVCDRS